jgi:uncharacterized protein YecE (DUF72 family)
LRGARFEFNGQRWQADELSFASRAFRTVEINGSFYSLQRPESYRAWHSATPDDFVFAVKGGRYITHMKRLRDVTPGLANFFDELAGWAARIRRWQRRQEVFVYFDNDVKVRAPFDARNLALLLAGKPTEAAPTLLEGVTEQPRRSWPAWR